MQIFSILAFPSRSSSLRSARQSGPVLLALGLFLLGPATTVQGQSDDERPIQARDLYRMQEVQDVALSPTGRFAAYTVRRVVRGGQRAAPTDAAHRTQLYVVPTSGREAPRLLTRSATSARQPAWHPDGTFLAFVRPVDGTPQVFVISLTGGEPYQLTETPYGAQHPQWSPNGDRLLFTSTVPQSAVHRRTGRPAPSERPGRTPGDMIRTPPPDTILVLRGARTLAPVDTLSLGPEGPRVQLRGRADTARALQTPGPGPDRDSLANQVAGQLAMLSADSLRTVLDSLRLRPDTATVPVVPDTAATPEGDLLQVRRWMHQNRQAGTALVSSRLELQAERRLDPTPSYRHHFVVDVPAGLRSGSPPRPSPTLATGGYRSYGRAEWLPGGTQLVVSGTPPTTRHPDRVQRRNLYVVDLNRSRIRRLLRLEDHTLTDPNVTADGTTVAFRVRSLSVPSDDQAEVGLFALDGRSEPRLLTSTLNRDVRSIRWSPDGWYLYTTAPSRSGVPIYRFSPFSPDTSASPSMSPDQAASRDTFALDSTMVRPAPYRQMTDDDRAVHDFDVTDATAVYALTDANTPSALFTNTVSFGNERRLSAHNAEWLSRRRVSPSTRITASSGRFDVEGWVTRPVPFVDSLRYPLLVHVRGGPPELSARHSPEAWFERQYLASRGFGIVEVLPRGSDGYGTRFRRANNQNWGPGPAQDVLAVADSAAALPWTDASQQAVTGASYGGTLATWLLGMTDRFDAAAALNGLSDLPTLLDTGRAWRVVPREFGGYPWEEARPLPTGPPILSVGPLPSFDRTASPGNALYHNSPLTQADQIDTPLLLMQGGADRRVGPSQSERLYKRLKILERPVEYVRYPGVGHDVSASATPRQRLDRLVRTYEFLARFLDFPPQSPSARPAREEGP